MDVERWYDYQEINFDNYAILKIDYELKRIKI